MINSADLKAKVPYTPCTSSLTQSLLLTLKLATFSVQNNIQHLTASFNIQSVYFKSMKNTLFPFFNQSAICKRVFLRNHALKMNIEKAFKGNINNALLSKQNNNLTLHVANVIIRETDTTMFVAHISCFRACFRSA